VIFYSENGVLYTAFVTRSLTARRQKVILAGETRFSGRCRRNLLTANVTASRDAHQDEKI